MKPIIIHPKKLFLIDSLGAIFSAFLLGVVLVQFERYFGMPRNVLFVLSIAACVFAVYSFTCYLFIKENWSPYLRLIAIVNLLYCCVTIGLVFYFHQQITVLGWLHFVGEIIVIVCLAFVELQTASKKVLPKV